MKACVERGVEEKLEETVVNAVRAWEHYLWLYDNFFVFLLDEETSLEVERSARAYPEPYAEEIVGAAAHAMPEFMSEALSRISVLPMFPDEYFFPLRFLELHSFFKECEQIVFEHEIEIASFVAKEMKTRCESEILNKSPEYDCDNIGF